MKVGLFFNFVVSFYTLVSVLFTDLDFAVSDGVAPNVQPQRL